ncbi:MAG: ABC transporter ATP-binding protein [Microbacteriaceae bacterium]|nr:ABC transporter ATP-binding protein [Microbacteriaceae bacterium]
MGIDDALDAPAEPLLVVAGLDVGYATSHVLDGVSLSVGVGESLGILGRNGMGKTTLVRAIMGLKPPTVTAGSVEFDGRPILGQPAHRIAALGMGLVPQGRQVWGSLTVRENLRIVPARRPEAGEEPWTVDRVFEFFPRLAERERSWARTLSGGEQQMLAIGRALMTNPRLLVMDEPSEGLAPAVLRVIRDRLQELRALGLSVLVAEQNVDLALALSDRVVMLGEHGRIAWSGSSRELVTDPAPIHAHLGL